MSAAGGLPAAPARRAPAPALPAAAAAAPAAAPPAAQTFLAFDFGQRRIGVAVGNSLLRVAQAVTTIKTVQAKGDARFAGIARLIEEWRPDALVVGVPFHPDGAEHDNTRRARAFGRQLHGRFRLPVHEVDERYSTTEARAQGALDADAAAAAIILNQFLRALPEAPGPSHPSPPPPPAPHAAAT